MKNKICVIGIYFGNLPNYFSLWKKSCECNPNVDFLILGDQKLTNLPPNVRSVFMTLDDIRTRATNILGFPARLDAPYKCCDYRVIFGLMFADYLDGYDYWGHCDFDMLFGDLKSFFEKHSLYSYDKFLTMGHLSLYRNIPSVNSRYQLAKGTCDSKNVYTMSENVAFDEIYGIGKVYLENKFSMFSERIFTDISCKYKRYCIVDNKKLETLKVNYKCQTFYWENGKIFRAFVDKGRIHIEESIYIHFRKRPNFEVTFDEKKCNAFYITNNGFEPKLGDVTVEDIMRLNPYPGRIYEKMEGICFKIKAVNESVKQKLKRVCLLKTNSKV